METFTSLDPLLRAFWLTAIPSSLIFALQSIMTFAGSDSMSGTHADFDGDL